MIHLAGILRNLKETWAALRAAALALALDPQAQQNNENYLPWIWCELIAELPDEVIFSGFS